MANINQTPSYKARLPHNGFPISKTSFFTATMGALYPTYWDYANPGDKYKFSAEMFVRTEAMTSPTFMKIRQVCRWFFVPLQQLYSPFGSIFYDINDIQSSLINPNNLTAVVPTASSASIMGYHSQPAFQNGVDEAGMPLSYGHTVLCEMLHYSNKLATTQIGTSQNPPPNYEINPLLACAYQKIYNDKFRLADRVDPSVSSYNLDTYYNSPMGITGQIFCNNFTKLRYAPYDKDFFTNGELNPLADVGNFSMLSSNAASLSTVNQWLNSSGLYPQMTEPSIRDNKTVASSQISSSSTSINQQQYIENRISAALQTSNIRSMFAIEKLSEITRRAAKHYDAQTLAHFGYDVPTGISGEVYEIGASSVPVQMSDVAATATTENSYLGELSGRGNGYSSGRPSNFVAPCHGILMAISYVVPTACYNGAQVLARENTYRERQDFYHPAFDRLGKQPLFKYQAVFDPVGTTTDNNTILNWQYRYQELKQKFDASYGAFNTSRRTWVAHRDNFDVYGNGSPLLPYIVSPTYLNGNMVVEFNGTAETDPFNCCHTYHVSKSSIMSTYGLPKL